MGVLIAFPTPAVSRRSRAHSVFRAHRQIEERAAEDRLKAYLATGCTAVAIAAIHLLASLV